MINYVVLGNTVMLPFLCWSLVYQTQSRGDGKVLNRHPVSFVVDVFLLVFGIPPETNPEETVGPEPSPRQAVLFLKEISNRGRGFR